METHVQVRTPQDSFTATPPPPPTKNAHPHVCSSCQASFRRDEHLQRHIRTHTGEKKYRCPCKKAFARKSVSRPVHGFHARADPELHLSSDVFVRHLRTCQPGLTDKLRGGNSEARSLNKTKRACDECAKAKAKCNYRIPCDRCHRRSIECEMTRKGYEDPYAVYSIATPATTPPVATVLDPDEIPAIDTQQIVEHGAVVDHIVGNGIALGHGPVVMIPPLDPALQVSEAMSISESEAGLSQDLSDSGQNAMALTLPSSPQFTQVRDNSSIYMDHASMMKEFDLSGSNPNFCLDADPVSLHLASMGNLDLLLNPQNQYQPMQGYDFFSFQQMPNPSISNGFSLNRLDPLRRKCDEIIELLRRASSHDADEIIYGYITRQNMVHLCHLYGKHFQQNMSIIHAPTFDMAQSPPTLLLAIMLVGACYTPDTIFPSQVAKLARRLLTAMALDPYETEMSCPSIALIQAGVLLCCVLSCSRDTAALRSVRICVARNISMCERAGLLDPAEPVDYNSLTEETFDWSLWIQQESGKRLACEIFCQDMVHCIFLGRTPDFDPCHFQVELPSYEGCWEAESAADCLRSLQSLPPPMRVASAMTILLSRPDSDAPLFEASGFGMFVLINGLHLLLHQATQADMETWRIFSPMPESESSNAINRLKDDPSGPNITAIADIAIKTHASPVIRRVDNALNAWRATWDLRSNRDSKHECCTFKGDPLPFWWLAKLYLLLHYHGHILQPDSEYASPRAEAPDNYVKSMVQKKVVGWLSNFRGRKFTMNAETENWLPELMKLTHEDPP